jgi:hypothetical protein
MKVPALFLLQSVGISDFQIQSNPIHGIIFLSGLAVIIFVIIFLNKSTKIKNSSVFRSGTIKKPQFGETGVKGLRKAAHRFGLEHDEQLFLAKMLRKESIDTSTVFSSTKNIDDGFSKIVHALNREMGTDDDIAKLFVIRNKIEYYLSADKYPQKTTDANLTLRRYKRAEVKIPVVFYLVFSKEIRAGLKKIKKLLLDSNKCVGTIIDISSGGCAINTRNPFKTGTRIKLEFKIGKNNLAALAQILRINHNRYGSVLHTRFLKVPVKALNAINSFVYNYKDI